MKFFGLNPEVSGQLGDGTEMDYSSAPYQVTRLEYVFDDWLGDDLLASHPAVIVTERLAKAIAAAELSGCSFAEMTVGTSEVWEDIGSGVELPVFRWLTLHGRPGDADFAPSPDPRFTLVVSKTALDVLQEFSLEQCEIEPYEGKAE